MRLQLPGSPVVPRLQRQLGYLPTESAGQVFSTSRTQRLPFHLNGARQRQAPSMSSWFDSQAILRQLGYLPTSSGPQVLGCDGGVRHLPSRSFVPCGHRQSPATRTMPPLQASGSSAGGFTLRLQRSPSQPELGGQHLPGTGVFDQPCGQVAGGVCKPSPQNVVPCFSNGANLASAKAVSSPALVLFVEPPAGFRISILFFQPHFTCEPEGATKLFGASISIVRSTLSPGSRLTGGWVQMPCSGWPRADWPSQTQGTDQLPFEGSTISPLNSVSRSSIGPL